jgi:membrane fusion protein (multidrug efflux system)
MISTRYIRPAVLAATVVTLAACQGEPELPERGPETPVSVRVSPVGSGSAAAFVPARVVPVQEAEVATRLAGTIASVSVDVGERVAAGATLATLDDADLRARIRAARGQAELARRTFQRVENLARDGAASPQELDEARARLSAAEGAAADAEAQGAYAVVRAPFAGTVTARMVDAGDMAAPGMPLMRLASGEVKVVADLPAERARSLEVGQAVEVEVGGTVLPGRILRVVQALDPASQRIRVEARVDGSPLPGTLARVRLAGSAAGPGTRWLPVDALVRSGQLTGVYSVESDTLRLRWVRLGQRSGDAVELLSGPAGELVVVRDPAPDLRDGQPVSTATPMPFDATGDASGAPTTGADR